jgi:ABC-type taurine transport system ATPase subunit
MLIAWLIVTENYQFSLQHEGVEQIEAGSIVINF